MRAGVVVAAFVVALVRVTPAFACDCGADVEARVWPADGDGDVARNAAVIVEVRGAQPSATVVVDGTAVDAAVFAGGSSPRFVYLITPMSWTPGVHTVDVEAVDPVGEPVTARSTFTVGAGEDTTDPTPATLGPSRAVCVEYCTADCYFFAPVVGPDAPRFFVVDDEPVPTAEGGGFTGAGPIVGDAECRHSFDSGFGGRHAVRFVEIAVDGRLVAGEALDLVFAADDDDDGFGDDIDRCPGVAGGIDQPDPLDPETMTGGCPAGEGEGEGDVDGEDDDDDDGDGDGCAAVPTSSAALAGLLVLLLRRRKPRAERL